MCQDNIGLSEAMKVLHESHLQQPEGLSCDAQAVEDHQDFFATPDFTSRLIISFNHQSLALLDPAGGTTKSIHTLLSWY